MSSEHPLMRPLRSDSLAPRASTQASWAPKQPVRTYEVPDLSFAPLPQEPAEHRAELPAAISDTAVPETVTPAEESIAAITESIEELCFAQETVIPAEESIKAVAESIEELCIAQETGIPAEESIKAVTESIEELCIAQETVIPAEEAAEPLWQPEEKNEPVIPTEEISLASSIALLLADQTSQPETEENDSSFMEWLELAVPAEEDSEPAVTPAENSLSATIAAILSGAEDDDDEDTTVLHDAVPDRFLPEPACVPLYDDPAPRRKKRGWLWLLALVIAAGGVYAAWKCGYLAIILP